MAAGIDHLRASIDLQAAKRKGNATCDGISAKWRFVDLIGPIRFSRVEIRGAFAIGFGGVKVNPTSALF